MPTVGLFSVFQSPPPPPHINLWGLKVIDACYELRHPLCWLWAIHPNVSMFFKCLSSDSCSLILVCLHSMQVTSVLAQAPVKYITANWNLYSLYDFYLVVTSMHSGGYCVCIFAFFLHACLICSAGLGLCAFWFRVSSKMHVDLKSYWL